MTGDDLPLDYPDDFIGPRERTLLLAPTEPAPVFPPSAAPLHSEELPEAAPRAARGMLLDSEDEQERLQSMEAGEGGGAVDFSESVVESAQNIVLAPAADTQDSSLPSTRYVDILK